MITFVEFQMINRMKSNFCRLEYLPNLAAGQIMACFKEKGIKAELVSGQTRYFRDVFINEQDELFRLLAGLKKEDLERAGQIGFGNLLMLYKYFLSGKSGLKDLLKKVYRVVSGQSEEDYLDKSRLLQTLRIKNALFELYDFYYSQKGEKNLSIINNLCKAVRKTKPDVLAFSFTSNYDYAHAEYLSDYVKEAINTLKKELDIPVIACSQLLPTMPALKEHIFKSLALDYFIFDDGLKTLPELVERLESSKPVDKISNLGYRKGGRIITTQNAEPPNFDELPCPDFSDFELDYYFFPKRMLPIGVSHVCNWGKCVFCGEVPNVKYCEMGREKFLEIINKYRRKFKTNFVEIQSTSPSPAQMVEYAKGMIENKIDNVFFALLSRLDDYYSKKNIAKTLYKGGVRYVMWGLESGCQKTLDRMNKGIRIDTARKILENFHEARIRSMCYVMVGFPGESREEFKKTLMFLERERKNIDGVVITPFNLFKNSLIPNNKEKFFIKSVFENPDNPATYKFKLSNGIPHEESKKIIGEVREAISNGKLRISRESNDPIDQFYLEKISGHDAMHHILFYLACKNQ